MLNEEESKWLAGRLSQESAVRHEGEMAVIIEQQEMNLFTMLKPKVSIDGNQYCVLYGDNLQEGIAGFGDTLMLAIYDFNKQFHKPIIKSAVHGAAGNCPTSTPAQQSYGASSEQPAP